MPAASSQAEARLRRRNGKIRGTPDLNKLKTFPDVLPSPYPQPPGPSTATGRDTWPSISGPSSYGSAGRHSSHSALTLFVAKPQNLPL